MQKIIIKESIFADAKDGSSHCVCVPGSANVVLGDAVLVLKNNKIQPVFITDLSLTIYGSSPWKESFPDCSVLDADRINKTCTIIRFLLTSGASANLAQAGVRRSV